MMSKRYRHESVLGGAPIVAKHNNVRRSLAPTTVAVDVDRASKLGGSSVEAFNKNLLRELLGCLCIANRDEAYQIEIAQAAMAALKAFRPNDEIEGMLAAQAVALHLGAMECFRRSMLRSQPGDHASRLRRDGANLARTMIEMVDAIDRKRGKRPQVVRVERVVVQDGGQAIVGNVSSGSATIPPQAVVGVTAPPVDQGVGSSGPLELALAPQLERGEP
jgi:hypothetical protein